MTALHPLPPIPHMQMRKDAEMSDVINGNASASAAISFHAEMLGVEPEEIGGRADA